MYLSLTLTLTHSLLATVNFKALYCLLKINPPSGDYTIVKGKLCWLNIAVKWLILILKRAFLIYSIDATFSKRKGRFINDGYGGSQNSYMKVVTIRGEPHLAVFATKHIKKGEEVRYDYGVPSLPWREKVNYSKGSQKIPQNS